MDSWFLEAEETAVRAARSDEIKKNPTGKFFQAGLAGLEEVFEARALFGAVGLYVNLL